MLSAFQLLPVFIISSFLLACPTLAKYQENDTVTLWVNKAGPYDNPQETYSYYSLPYCRPADGDHKRGGLGEVLGGNDLIDSRIDIKFKRDVERRSICELKLDASKIAQFKYAIDNMYWFEFFIDDLPMWGFVGGVYGYGYGDTNKHVVYTHKMLHITYNRDQIIHLNLSQEIPKPLEEGRTLNMTYSVKWSPTEVSYAQRFDIYLNYYFFENEIHWFSILNSIMMVIFLTGLVSMILMRTLHNDYAKYARENDDMETLEKDVIEESGWKLVHGDVFRPPQNLALLSAVVGTGAQLAILVLLVIISAYLWRMYTRRGAIITTSIVCYALTSFISGYVSGGLYSRNAGENWIKSMVLTASFFPFLCFGTGFVLNSIAIFYESIAVIPLGTIVVVFVIWAFISLPLSFLGTVVGRNWSGTPDNPCRVKNIPRPIPEKKWYLRPSVISLVGGLLPFASIFIEMYFVFASLWNYMVHYYVYGFMLLVFIVLIIVTVCVTILGTYFLLNAENYHWQWTSFFSAASTALYVYLYAIYYYHAKTRMSGLFQTSFYFGYTLMFCLGVGILCGAVGYLGSNLFVRRIFRNIKCD
ncbi:Transmembrane 9 superfamily member 3 [Capsicum annuum]|uniref:transmembrane 9 superfamily member 1 n=1 Tax=Capsicum annuum TaxID=4072 RepID=UPI0007BF59C6|nr:transmembrane 9 superfamily member 1 [Capsicum annuum]KAF3675376.1 Transmembrane 9 superfamily member 3 [Capsicum annuum]